ncbi:MAG: Nramp family divalent metal transporter [Saprospiraceae bacterium]
MQSDPYQISSDTIKEPPTRLVDRLKFLGPGFILSASVVGSGELIATTILGAKAGYAAFWIIILSCLIKVAVQLQFGKHAILSGETTLRAFDKIPGFRIRKGSWAVWAVLFMTFLKIIQLGGMVGSAALVMNMLFHGGNLLIWAIVIAFSASLLIYKDYYPVVEKGSLFMIVSFTLLTLGSLALLSRTSFAFTLADVWDGMSIHLTRDQIIVAIGAFGITGVASDEIIAYNYWCIEKGYAAYTGPKNPDHEDPARNARAQGWIKVMLLDAVVAMIIYTSVTAAFYLLGAAILHQSGVVPEGNSLIEKIALIYTTSLGPGVKVVYLIGAFFVLYSSVFAALAAWTRLYSDGFGILGWIDFKDLIQRKKMVAILSFAFPALWIIMYLSINLPVLMILSGGMVGSVLLILVAYAAIHFKYQRKLEPVNGRIYNLFFWVSLLSILFVSIYGLYSLFQ